MKPRKALTVPRNRLPRPGAHKQLLLSPTGSLLGTKAGRSGEEEASVLVKKPRVEIEECVSQRPPSPPRPVPKAIPLRLIPQDAAWPSSHDWKLPKNVTTKSRPRSPRPSSCPRRTKQSKLTHFGNVTTNKAALAPDIVIVDEVKADPGPSVSTDSILKPEVTIEEFQTQVPSRHLGLTVDNASRISDEPEYGSDSAEEDEGEPCLSPVLFSQAEIASSQPATRVLDKFCQIYGVSSQHETEAQATWESVQSNATTDMMKNCGLAKRSVFPRLTKPKYVRGGLAGRLSALTRSDNNNRYLWKEKKIHLVPSASDSDGLPECLVLRVVGIFPSDTHLLDVHCRICQVKDGNSSLFVSSSLVELQKRLLNVVFARDDFGKFDFKLDDIFALLRPWVTYSDSRSSVITIFCPYYVTCLTKSS